MSETLKHKGIATSECNMAAESTIGGIADWICSKINQPRDIDKSRCPACETLLRMRYEFGEWVDAEKECPPFGERPYHVLCQFCDGTQSYTTSWNAPHNSRVRRWWRWTAKIPDPPTIYNEDDIAYKEWRGAAKDAASLRESWDAALVYARKDIK